MIENRKNYRLDVDKIKTLKDVKNVLDNLHLIGYYDADDPNDENYYLSEYFTIPQERQGLTFSTPRKSIDEIQQEFDEKIDKLIEKTKEKFECSNYFAGKRYNEKFDRIIWDFEYAKEHGSFPQKLTFTIGDGLSANNWTTSNFVIKSNSMGVGYWDVKPNIQIWLQVKPNWLVRKCAKIFFDFGWKDA